MKIQLQPTQRWAKANLNYFHGCLKMSWQSSKLTSFALLLFGYGLFFQSTSKMIALFRVALKFSYLYQIIFIMELTLTTPALLFPTVSLVLLAYTNRFLAVATLIRKLADDYTKREDKRVADQIRNLKIRLRLIRDMQLYSILALFMSVLCMFFLFNGQEVIAKYVFGASLITLLFSLGLSMREIYISTRALSIQLSDIAKDVKL